MPHEVDRRTGEAVFYYPDKGFSANPAKNVFRPDLESIRPDLRAVHQDLIAHDKLPDPFYGMNEQKIQWVEKEDWLYRTSFVLTEEQLHHEGVYLVFEGLDTYADVFLNGSLLLKQIICLWGIGFLSSLF